MMQTVQYTEPPPPSLPNMSVPPPTMAPTSIPPPSSVTNGVITIPPPNFVGRFQSQNNALVRPQHFQVFRPYPRPGLVATIDAEFDGKRLRKSVMRKTVDYNAAIIKMLENRVWQRDFRDRRALQPDVLFYPDLMPPPNYKDNPINSVTTRFVKAATNKMRCPIFCMAWTPEGRRLITGASSGEFTLWNGLTFNFETILQAHDTPVRTMVWSHNDIWMVTGDHAGYVKYWQSNMNNVKMFQAHKEALRGLSFSPSDQKFVTCSDDGCLRIWDFQRCYEERTLRGHGADVKCVHWHPQKGLIISGSKDNQQPVKLWDPKSGQALATLHAHKSTVMDIKWNQNGNWVVTASRDHLLKLFDIRKFSVEVQTFRGHKKEASSITWHPYHEGLFASGGSDGAILFWHVGADKEVGAIDQAHDSIVWTLAWHPLGHILCSGSNDHTSKFWTRNRPGDQMRDKYNLNTLPSLSGLENEDMDEPSAIPGMGPEDKVDEVVETITLPTSSAANPAVIPGLDFEGVDDKQKAPTKKVPYSKPIPRNFQAQWNETCRGQDDDEDSDDDDRTKINTSHIKEVLNQIIETTPGAIPLSDIKAEALVLFGKVLPLEGNPVLADALASGPEALERLIFSGAIEELHDVMPHVDLDDYNMKDESLDTNQDSNASINSSLDNSCSKPSLGSIGSMNQNDGMNPSSNFPSQNSGDSDMRMLGIPPPRALLPCPDQDMRFSSADIDFRQPVINPGDEDMRNFRMERDIHMFNSGSQMDEDMRHHNIGEGRLLDQDLRSGIPPLLPPNSSQDQDLRQMPRNNDVDIRFMRGSGFSSDDHNRPFNPGNRGRWSDPDNNRDGRPPQRSLFGQRNKFSMQESNEDLLNDQGPGFDQNQEMRSGRNFNNDMHQGNQYRGSDMGMRPDKGSNYQMGQEPFQNSRRNFDSKFGGDKKYPPDLRDIKTFNVSREMDDNRLSGRKERLDDYDGEGRYNESENYDDDWSSRSQYPRSGRGRIRGRGGKRNRGRSPRRGFDRGRNRQSRQDSNMD